jgi:exodeoxyribonuclease-3
MHLVSWNVNGIRAIIKKEFVASVRAMAPDVIGLQETKAAKEEVLTALEVLPEYKVYANSSKARKGYSGTAILTKTEPIDVTYDMGIDVHDQEGRVDNRRICYVLFYVTVYTPNAGEGLGPTGLSPNVGRCFSRIPVLWLNRRKPVIVCGDFNVAHKPIDLAHPKPNYNKSAGYTQQEIDGFDKLLGTLDLVDTFRSFLSGGR